MGGLLSLSLCHTGVSWAGSDSLGVVPTTHQNKLESVARSELDGRLQTGLKRGEAPLVSRDGTDASCDESCRTEFREAGASHFVRPSIEQKSRDYTVKLELVDTSTGDVVAQTTATCEICGLEELGELVEGQGAILQTKLAALDVQAPTLTVNSKPSGAVVFVDGEAVGKTPLERQMLPGEHVVRVSRNGFVAEERQVTMVDGVAQSVDVQLKRAPGNRRNIILGAVATGVGAALLGTGIGFLAVNDKPQRNCAPENMDADGDCAFVYKTAGTGAALAIPGAILATVGVMLLIQNRDLIGKKRKRTAHRLRPGISPFGVSLSGQF